MPRDEQARPYAVAKRPTIVIGAGISGLAAAHELAAAGQEVLVLEARERLGGRIHTQHASIGEAVELGAEFIHGKPPKLCDLIRQAGLDTRGVAERQRLRQGADSIDPTMFSEAYSRCVNSVDFTREDQAFAAFLESQPDSPRGWKRYATGFVEGFEAADANRISVHSLAREQEATERIDGDRLFRVGKGYGAVVGWFQERLQALGVAVHRGVTVRTVRWGAGNVEAIDGQGRRFGAGRAIITLPLGVLKTGSVEFVPDIGEKAAAIQVLEMGHAMKATLQFRSRFWEEENFGFIQSLEDPFPTCWSHERGHLLTLWAGGPGAKRMAGSTEEEIRGAAIGSLTHMFGVESKLVERELVSFMFHDWTADPFTRGAYSYIPAGSVEAQQSLADPILNTLFFAGEATALDAQLGTVHGALGSGIRAAQQILRAETLT